jgi:hypothetical protein
MVRNVYREQLCLNGIKDSNKAQKLGKPKSRVKTMFTEFFYVKGIIHHELVPEIDSK